MAVWGMIRAVGTRRGIADIRSSGRRTSKIAGASGVPMRRRVLCGVIVPNWGMGCILVTGQGCDAWALASRGGRGPHGLRVVACGGVVKCQPRASADGLCQLAQKLQAEGFGIVLQAPGSDDKAFGSDDPAAVVAGDGLRRGRGPRWRWR